MKVRTHIAIAFATLLAWRSPQAGIVYRCVAPDGTPNYTSKKWPGVECKAVFRTWQPIYSDSNLSISVSPKTIRWNQGRIKAWLLESWIQPQRAPGLEKPYLSLKLFVTHDCAQRTYTEHQRVAYTEAEGTGEFVGSLQNPAPSPADIIPDTVGEVVLERLCAMRQGNN